MNERNMTKNRPIKSKVSRVRKATSSGLFVNKTSNHIVEDIETVRFWHGFDRVVSVATLAGIILAIVVFVIQLVQRQQDIEFRDAKKYTDAMKILKNGVAGDNGKSNAIQTLIDGNIGFYNLELDCVSVGGVNCSPSDVLDGNFDGVVLANISFAKPWHLRKEPQVNFFRLVVNGSRLLNIHFRDFHAEHWVLASSKIENLYVSGSKLANFNFVNAYLEGSFFHNSKIVDASFYHAKLEQARFSNSNIINVDFEGATFLFTSFVDSQISNSNFANIQANGGLDLQFKNVWAWKDWPPNELPKHLPVKLCIFDEQKHNRDERPTEC